MGSDSGGRRRSRRSPEALAERRAARAEITELAPVVEFAGRFLEARSRSVGEVRRRLTSAGFRPVLVEDAISRLIELGFLDDATFATSWVESRDRARPRGEHALRRELSLKGIERTVIDAVLAARRGDGEGDATLEEASGLGDADRAAAERLLDRRRAALLRESDPRKRRQKAYALLARNGFAPDVAGEVARRIGDVAEDADGPEA